eukprot:CAMPEP_0119065830 /NCGR_PEP_ID=MMETSP1178-20130426/8553_1 /TAXON_ID=33656 /ORGANISM="unid sp, Strain CCMP2000" /LENGTH=59 /DNA_ID=CAMNT_0007047383 /DNA_START=45 /DNA_END=220 /DNA_ORIENTATION=+
MSAAIHVGHHLARHLVFVDADALLGSTPSTSGPMARAPASALAAAASPAAARTNELLMP